MGQFYVHNLRTLSICQQLAKSPFVNSSVDRRHVDNSPKVDLFDFYLIQDDVSELIHTRRVVDEFLQ